MTEPRVADVLERHEVVVCVGTGGVGKTTVAAAMALGGALRGRRAMVLTIDPARQLARALGLASLASGGERVADEVLAQAGRSPRGTLDAAMLDQKAAWDALVSRHAPSEEVRERIIGNRFYQQLSTSFAGSTEYVAVEELCRIDESGRYDLIVLDTPPTGGALDFLRAPERIDRLLDREVVGWLARPLSDLQKIVRERAGAAVALLLRRLERATGSSTLQDISSFFAAAAAMLEDIERRTAQARALVHGGRTAFVLVTGPNEQVLAGTQALRESIRELEVPMRAAVLNRAHVLPDGEPASEDIDSVLQRARSAGADDASIDWIGRTYDRARALQREEMQRWAAFVRTLPPSTAQAVLPELDHDLHRAADLASVADRLWSG